MDGIRVSTMMMMMILLQCLYLIKSVYSELYKFPFLVSFPDCKEGTGGNQNTERNFLASWLFVKISQCSIFWVFCKWKEEENPTEIFDQCWQLFLTVVNMHEACVYLSYYGAVTFFLQMEPVRQEQGAHVKQNTHAMQREKQHACNVMQCNKKSSMEAMQWLKQTHMQWNEKSIMQKHCNVTCNAMRKATCMQGNATCNAK